MGNCLSGNSDDGARVTRAQSSRRNQNFPNERRSEVRPPKHFSRIDNYPPSQLYPRDVLVSGNSPNDCKYKVPNTCPVISPDAGIDLVDLLEKKSRGPAMWRANYEMLGKKK